MTMIPEKVLGADGRHELPDEWRWVRLGDVSKIVSGSTPDTTNGDYWDGDIVWVTPTDLGKLPTRDISSSARRITKTGYDNSGTEIVPPGSVVMSSRAPIGHLGIARVPLCTNQGCKSFVPGDRLDGEYLFFALKRSVDELRALGSGATFAEVSKSTVEAFRIPLPPLPEQQRIAALLTQKMAAVDTARAAAEAQLAAAKALPAAYFQALFNGTEAQQWPRKRIGDVAKVQSGYAFKSDWFTGDGIRLLRNANIFQGYISWADSVHLPSARRAEFPAYELSVGDIVLALDRPLVSNGLKVARLTSGDVPALLLQRVARFQLREGIDADCLFAFLNSHDFIRAITQHDQSVGVPHVSPGQVESVLIPVPPLDVQKMMSARLGQHLEATHQTIKAGTAQLGAINFMPPALLREAFSGRM